MRSAMSKQPVEELRTQFRVAMRRYPAAVTIVTASDNQRRHGMTATAVTSLSLDPPSLLVCLKRTTLRPDFILTARLFSERAVGHEKAQLSGALTVSLPPSSQF